MNTAQLIEEAVAGRAQDIKDYIALGWSREAAIAYVRESSTLGPVSWARVMALVA